jgi:hypothetical protein
VAAVQGIVLTAVTACVRPRVVAAPALLLVAALHAESHRREVGWPRRSDRAGPGAASESWAVGWVHA